MKLHFFAIPALHPGAAQDELNRQVASHRVSQVERQFVADGATSFWSVCFTAVDGAAPAAAATETRRGKAIDHRNVLSASDFGIYDRLRRLRKGLAESEGLPPYAVFTNDQLATMVQARATTASDLARIEGVGDARIQRYGAAMLAAPAGLPGWPVRPGGEARRSRRGSRPVAETPSGPTFWRSGC